MLRSWLQNTHVHRVTTDDKERDVDYDNNNINNNGDSA